MYLTAIVLQLVLFNQIGVPFALNVAVTMIIVWLYTFRGGVKTLVWTDMLQTLSLIMAVVLCIYFVCKQMGLDLGSLCSSIASSEMSDTWFFSDYNDKRFFFKQFLAGMFTTIAMTGLDQDMMQKNLSCRTLKDAQKNVISYGFGFLPVNLLFLALGILLYNYAAQLGLFANGALTDIQGNALKSDELFPYLATATGADGVPFLPAAVGVLFILGLVFLIKGGDWFVDGAAGIAERFHRLCLQLLRRHDHHGPSEHERALRQTLFKLKPRLPAHGAKGDGSFWHYFSRTFSCTSRGAGAG